MAKSQRESRLREGPRPSLREAPIHRGDVAISKASPRGREQCLARARNTRFRHCEERSDEAISKWAA